MQVSWIEADELKDLLARIAPSEPAAPAPWSWDVMPTVDPETAASFIITADEPFVTEGPVQEVIPPEPKPEQEFPAPASATTDTKKEAAMPPSPHAPSASEPVVSAETPVPEDSSDHSAAALPLSRIRDKLRAIRQRAHEAGMLSKSGDNAPAPPPQQPAPEAQPPPKRPEQATTDSASSLPKFEPPVGGRQERLAAFATWARHILHEDGGHLLVMNDDGDLLWGGEAKAGLVLSAMMAWGATLRSSASSACGSLPVLHQALSSGHMLTAIPCETSTGVLLHAAVVGPARVPEETAVQLRQALIRAAGTQFA